MCMTKTAICITAYIELHNYSYLFDKAILISNIRLLVCSLFTCKVLPLLANVVKYKVFEKI